MYYAARASAGEGKTDAKDAAVIAEQARVRNDLRPMNSRDQISTDLRLLAGHRADIVADRTRTFNRMRALLLEYFPGLEAEFDYASHKAALLMLTKYQTPKNIRSAGQARITAFLVKHKTRNAALFAERAVRVAREQTSTLPAEHTGARLVAKLTQDLLNMFNEVAIIDRQIEARFREHDYAEILLSMPGFGPLLGADFLASIGGNLANFTSADRLAAISGLAPVPLDSGRISGNLHRPKRYDRKLLRANYLAAQTASIYCLESKAFYQRKRAEGKRHTQAILALARRRLNVLYAMLRDHQTFQNRQPTSLNAAA